MSFAQSADKYRGVPANIVMVIIPFLNGGADTGGTIKTGLKSILTAFGVPRGSVVAANQIRVSSISGGDVTIVTDADVDGDLVAYGFGY